MAVALARRPPRRGRQARPAIVIGCGPIGLAVICMLKAAGVRTVVASDFSPAAARSPAHAARTSSSTPPGLALSRPPATAASSTTSRRPSSSPSARARSSSACRSAGGTAWRARRDARDRKPKHPVIFECVGVPGVIESIINGAPLFSRVVVVGVCMGADRFTPVDGDQQGDRPALRARLHARWSSATRFT